MKTKDKNEIVENIKNEKKWLILGNLFFLVFISYVVIYIKGGCHTLDVVGEEIFREPEINGLKLLLETCSYFAGWEIISIISLVLIAFDKSRGKLGVPTAIVAATIFIFTKAVDYLMISNGFGDFITTEAALLVGVYGILGYLVKKYNWKEKSFIYDVIIILIAITGSFSILLVGNIKLSVFVAGVLIGLFILFLAIGKMKVLGIIKK